LLVDDLHPQIADGLQCGRILPAEPVLDRGGGLQTDEGQGGDGEQDEQDQPVPAAIRTKSGTTGAR
jgi:hypothetical protein